MNIFNSNFLNFTNLIILFKQTTAIILINSITTKIKKDIKYTIWFPFVLGSISQLQLSIFYFILLYVI